MYMRNILLALLIITLAACRANPAKPGSVAQESQSAKESENTTLENKKNKTENTEIDTPPTSGSGSYLAGDGPGTNTPDNLAVIPDAVPRAEPLHRYANRPYTVLGKNYTPLTQTGTYKERGVASWYGKKFHGQRTSIGEVYDMYGMTAAHTTLPIPSYAKVTNLANQKSVIVRINDRGPFLHDRIIDLSYTAAAKLGIIGKGQGMVEVESINTENSASIYKEPLHITALPPAPTSVDAPAGSVYLQLGAFNSQSGAEEFLRNMRTKLSVTGKQLSLSHNKGMVKVRIGPYNNEDTARAKAIELQSRLGFKPILSLY